MDPLLLANLLVVPFWLLLILAPRWSVTWRLAHAPVVPLALAGGYLAYALPGFLTGAPDGGGFGSLKEVMILFQSPQAVMAGWIHYLVFDLFVGAWEARDAQRRGVPHWMLVPCLILTFMLGPVGLALYLLIRWARTRTWGLSEDAA